METKKKEVIVCLNPEVYSRKGEIKKDKPETSLARVALATGILLISTGWALCAAVRKFTGP